ncbi:MAG: cytochrome c oxidase subunit II [Myxococcaceae bacterium]
MSSFLRKVLLLPEQASTIAPEIDWLHFVIITVTFAAFLVLGTLTLTFIVRYRRRTESTPTPRIVAPAWLELGIAAFTLGFFLWTFYVGFRDFTAASAPPPGAMDVYVTGKQWMWTFTYPEGPSSIGELRVPAGRPVRLLLTSRDVIHSFYVPAFRLKKDAVPSRYTELWFEATSRGEHPIFCTEYCGLDHSRMLGRVTVMELEEFESWLRAETEKFVADRGVEDVSGGPRGGPPLNLRERGRAVAARVGCLKCHSVDGSPHIGPTWLDLYRRRERLSTGEEIVVDEAYITESMMDPTAKIVAGFAPVMPSFKGQLMPAETAAIVEYIRALRTLGVEHERTQGPVYEPIP